MDEVKPYREVREYLIVMGIDPGTATTGYGVVAFRVKQRLDPITYGVIRTPAKEPLTQRLAAIYSDVTRLIDTYKPDAIAVEELFFSRNTTTALAVGQARGVSLLAAAQFKITVSEYTPSQVKLAVTGQGKADKQQVAYMVRLLLGLSEIPKPDDAADALAIAICHAHHAEGSMRRLAGLGDSGGSVLL